MSKFIEVTTYIGSSRGVVTWPATGAPAQAYAADEVYPPLPYAEAPATVDDLPGRGNMRVSLSLSLVDPRESAWLTLNGIRYAMYHQWAGWFTLDLPETAPNPFHVGRNEVVLELIVSGSPHAFPLVLEAVEKDGKIGHDPNSNIIGAITPADLVVNIPPTGAVTIGSVRSLSAGFRVAHWTGAALWWGQYKEATLPPFWTKFVRTFEDTSVAGGEVVPVPDPSSKTFDFVVRTQQGVFPFMGSTQLYRGYVMHNIGSVAPERITLGGVSGALTAVVYATESGVLRIVIQGVFGATGARLELGGEVYEVATDRYNTIGAVVDVALSASPLVLGARQAGRLRLEGDLQATPVPYDPEPGDVVVLGAEMVVGEFSPDPFMVGYDTYGEVGTLVPSAFAVGPYTARIELVGLSDGAVFYPEWAGRTGVVVIVSFDVPVVGIEFSEALFRIGEREVDISTVDPAIFMGVFDTDWLPAVDSTHPIEVEFRDLVIYEDTPTPPYEPVGDPIAVVIEAAGEDSPVGFSYNARGSVWPSTIEYEGRTLTIVTADMYIDEGSVELFFELNGDVTGLAFAGSGFDIGGVLVGVEAGNYGSSVQFWAWHEDLQPWQDGETYTITFYPGEEE